MIPKTIHYCWFGRNPKPKLAEKCLRSWKKHCPDYEIIEWNEDNYDLFSAPLYVRQAYEAKKWAFVTDYVRLDVIYHNGGIYLDTDVEVVRSLDPLLCDKAFFGIETPLYVATGLGFGAEKGSEILAEMMKDYQEIPFIQPDGSYDQTTCPVRNTNVLLKHGFARDGSEQLLDGEIHIYPEEFFCPLDYQGLGRIIDNKTFSIHWFSGSWMPLKDQPARRIIKNHRKQKMHIILQAILGEKNHEMIMNVWKRMRGAYKNSF